MVLRSVASRNSVAENEIVRLYLAATDVLVTGTTKTGNLSIQKFTHLVDPPKCPGHRYEMVTVTNPSGLFVKLTMECQKAAGSILLSTGKNYSMEGVDAVGSTVTTRMF